ncbi:glycosyl hydrolase family 28-related protein [Fictibacillus terranigra]|uniref:Glycosyl hydrolase family 28-related protein n=1 Tax=Fictibacillus terranigra TaxID=3058424 RepID=A0ABT8E0N5_9BACL|nr:glycosyl hydrolase family 28-related protein [Fictibacillus sp. CENA-BCM004]MDN4071463.1 glycosyl hydrolase family 28-related protein [Fictibacillus sp. CENA-BCM004]
MLSLNKDHNPLTNKELIGSFSEYKDGLQNLLAETDTLFQELNPLPEPAHTSSFSLKNVLHGLPKFLLSTSSHKNQDPLPQIETDEEGGIYPDWKKKLDQALIHLEQEIEQEVNVRDFGAAGDGITDDTEAFRKAIGHGRAKVLIPAGVYITRGIRLPSWTMLIGAGKGLTTIKLHDKAPRGRQLVTNASHWRGNHHIYVQGMSLDWNVERLDPYKKTASGNNQSSCLTYAHVTFGWVKEVEGINPGLHCFDVSSAIYTYFGDATRARRSSRYIWLDQLNGYGFGDDGITTHHSVNILISNCHLCDPSGRSHKEGFSNSNGIEVDDGSRNVMLLNNSTTRCFGGVEIKAHHNSAAASNTQIVGHISINDNRAYNFRHIGHHIETDPESKTAFNIKASHIVAVSPIRTPLYKDSTPRAMVISAYKNVAINHFTVIGDPEYDYRGEPIIAVQYRSRNIILHDLNIRNFKTAGADIKVFGGPHGADSVEIRKVKIRNSAPTAVHIGPHIQSIKISDVQAVCEKGNKGLVVDQSNAKIEDFHSLGYKTPISIANTQQA